MYTQLGHIVYINSLLNLTSSFVYIFLKLQREKLYFNRLTLTFLSTVLLRGGIGMKEKRWKVFKVNLGSSCLVWVVTLVTLEERPSKTDYITNTSHNTTEKHKLDGVVSFDEIETILYYYCREVWKKNDLNWDKKKSINI